MPHRLYLRPPLPAEGRAWVEVKDRSWRAAYESMFHTSMLSEREEKWPKNAERWAGVFGELDYDGWTQRDGVPFRFLGAFWDGQMVGVAAKRCSAPDRHVDAAERQEDAISLPPTELGMLYTVPEVWGEGVGDALIQQLPGQDSAYLWTLRENHRAVQFFQDHGFYREGRQAVLVDHPAMRMVRDLPRLKPA